MGEVIDFKKGLAAEVIPLFAGAPSPVVPRDQFGLKTSPVRAAMELAEYADRRADAFERAIQRSPAPARAFDGDEVIALCNVLDLAAETARDLGKRAGRAAGFGLIAQDIDSLSERLAHLLADIVGDER